VRIANQTYLIKLYSVYEKVKQAQLGLDSQSRIELRRIEKAIKEKIIEVEATMQKNNKKAVV